MLKKKKSRKARVIASRLADKNNAVVTVVGGSGKHVNKPCDQCPWRIDQAGKFPAEAFRISVNVAYDQSFHIFGCHMAGAGRPAACAGFLLKNSANNIGARLAARGDIDFEVLNDGGLELYNSYREMAIANGVPADDASLESCRGDDD